MTEMLNKELSRRAFVKGGGALIVGFSVLGSALAGKASAAVSPYASNPIDQFAIDAWITIHADNTATIKTGGIKQGTGADTGLLMIAGEELDMGMTQLRFAIADTAVTPDTGTHSASNTIINAGAAIRAAAAAARQALLGLASTQLGVPASQLAVSKGVVSGGGKSVTYGQLIGDKLFNVRMPASWNMNPTATGGFGGPRPGAPGQGLMAGQAPAKPVSQYKLVGISPSPPRIDIPAIVTGSEAYIQNIRVPGMLHGRVVRPRGQTVYGFGAPIVSVDESSVKHIPGVRVVRKNDFLGVVAPDEYAAIQASAQLKVKWADPPAVLPGGGNEYKAMRALVDAGKSTTIRNAANAPRNVADLGNVDAALASAAHVVSAEYGFPTLAQTPIGPSAAVADVTSQGVRIFSGTQGAYQTGVLVATTLGLPVSQVRVTACAMGGCFGPGMRYSDTAIAAALMSQAVGAPVRVQLMRWDEIGWNQMDAGTLMDVRAGIDSKGNLVAVDVTTIRSQHTGVGTSGWRGPSDWPSGVLAGAPLPPIRESSAFAPASMYNVPNARYTGKSIQAVGNWTTHGALRGVTAQKVNFGGEQMIDELAYAAKMDPVAFRIQNVVPGNDFAQGEHRDDLLALLQAVTKASGWQPRVSGSNLSDGNVVTGRGVAWGNNYNPVGMGQAAAIADVEVNKKTGKVVVKHVYYAMSAGLAVYPDGIENQIVGGVTQGVSWMLHEQVVYSRTNVASGDFVTYPILRFKDAPKITPIVIQRGATNPYAAGIGETAAMVAPAMVANAFFDATGVRMRTGPFTPPRVRAALKAAGVK